MIRRVDTIASVDVCWKVDCMDTLMSGRCEVGDGVVVRRWEDQVSRAFIVERVRKQRTKQKLAPVMAAGMMLDQRQQ